MRNGTVFQRRPLAPLTAATGSGLLPTPAAVEYGSNQGGGMGRVGPVRPSLGTMARKGLWPTPASRDSKGPSSRHWGVLTRGEAPPAGSGAMDLPTTVLMQERWPTPNARDGSHGGAADPQIRRQQGHAVGLDDAVHQGPGNGSLNPTWVEWLMGFPLGWGQVETLTPACLSELGRQNAMKRWAGGTESPTSDESPTGSPNEPTDSEPSETPSSPKSRSGSGIESSNGRTPMPRSFEDMVAEATQDGSPAPGPHHPGDAHPAPAADMRVAQPPGPPAADPITGEIIDLTAVDSAFLAGYVDSLGAMLTALTEWRHNAQDELGRRLGDEKVRVFGDWEVAAVSGRGRKWDAEDLREAVSRLLDLDVLSTDDVQGLIVAEPKVNGTLARDLLQRVRAEHRPELESCFTWERKSRDTVRVTRSGALH